MAAPQRGSEILRIDEVCDQHELALQSGKTPDLAKALEGFDDESRSALFGELLLIEIQHRQKLSQTETATVQAIREAHPELTDELVEAVELVKHRIGIGAAQHSQAWTSDGIPLLGGVTAGSNSFEVYCPHCHELCGIPHSSEITKVTCGVCGNTFDLADQALETEQAVTLKSIGHFDLTSRLGMGGCGTVWKAYDSQLNRTVAVKIPRAGQLTDSDEERFLREAQTVARLQHPNIVPVHEFGRDGKILYFVTNYVRGVSLSEWLTGRRLPIREAVEMVIKVADALHYAHEQGVIHRDIKPSNILLDANGEPHVTDFGLAKLERLEPSDAEGALLGTPAYMSPEQAVGEAHLCDPRTDVYGLGVVLFQLITNELPFRGNRQMLLHQIQFDEPISPRKLNANIPKDLETLCLKCLQKPMASRYPTAHAMAEDLRRFLRGEPITARPVSLPVRGWRWCLRNRSAAAALAMLVLIAIAGPAIAVYQSALRSRAVRSEAEAHRYYKQYIALGMLPAQPDDKGDQQSIAFETTISTHQLVDSAHSHALTQLRILNADSSDEEELAYLQLAAGVLADANGSHEEAIRHLERARDTVVRLQTQQPDEIRYQAAEAFCKSRLVQLYAEMGNYEGSTSLEAQANDTANVWASLARKHPKDFSYQRSLVEAQFLLSLTQALRGLPTALGSLKEGKRTVDAIGARWPDDPRQLYLIACELAKCRPVLADDSSQQIPTLQ